jgi:hypothetical protein
MDVRNDIPKVSQDAIDEVVAEVTRKGSIGPKSSLLPLLTPWLLKITDAEPFDVCTYTMSRNGFWDWMTDRDLCEHVAAKVRLEPIRKEVESVGSVVIHCAAPFVRKEGAGCGRRSIVELMLARGCAIRAI